MPDHDESAYRRHYQATGEEITVRESDEVESEDGVFEIRMPIASTGEVRNTDDDPLTRDELEGMARQLQERQIGVFPAHGTDDKISADRYSPFERLGDWQEAEMQSRESDDVLMATARMPDPETLPQATGSYREALAILKEQAKRGIAQDSSIGWREDDSFPGGNDLMEASIVGIGADWRTNTGDEAAEVVTQAAVDAGADPDALLEGVRAALDADTSDTDTQDNDMTDENTDDEPTDEQSEQVDREEAPAWADDIRDLLESIHDAVREDDMDDDEDDEDEDEDDEDEEQAADTEDEQSTDGTPDDEQDAEAEALKREVETLREELDDIRANDLSAEDVDTPESDDEQDADPDETQASEESDGDPDAAPSGPNWRN